MRRINRIHFGTVRTYLDRSKAIVTGVTYTVAEMTKLLGKCSKTMRLWMGDERFPKPTKVTYVKEGMHHLAVYTEEEAEAILYVLIEHYREKYQLSIDDTKTRKELLSAVYGTGAILTIPC
jgi:hypothetical protein